MKNREPRFEVLWYKDDGDYESQDFYTRKQALAFYEQHKNDKDKHDFWVTHRNSDWEVIEDIII